jgi:hypothetical protein
MKAEDHTQWVDAIVTNLQALEAVLRYFLAKMNNEEIEFPRVGDKLVKLSYFTRFISLGKLVKTYNEALKRVGQFNDQSRQRGFELRLRSNFERKGYAAVNLPA